VRAFERQLWTEVHSQCNGGFRLRDDGLPEKGAENIGLAYRAIMSGRATSGLSDPEWRRRYLRDLCSRIGDRVNGAHIYLASILRAQERWPEDGLSSGHSAAPSSPRTSIRSSSVVYSS
jgi:hypothetical protein